MRSSSQVHATTWLAGLAAAGLASCASYGERVGGALADFEAGNFQPAIEAFSDKSRTDSTFLSGAEAGMVALVAGDWERAIQELSRAASISDELADRGPLSVSGGVEMLGSLLLNDRVGSYEGEGFERVYAHAALGLAYLGQGNLESTRVEARRANQLLENEEDLYDTSYAAGGLGHFLSAVCYLLDADYDDALIDLRRMLDKGVGLGLAGPAARWIVEFTGRDDVASQVQQFRALELPDIEGPPAWIVVFAGAGSAPYKVERSIAFPTPGGIVSLASPDYVVRGAAVDALELRVDGTRHRTHVIEDVAAVAIQNLEDRLTAVAIRSVARNAGRLAIRNQVEDEHGAGAAALIDLFTLVMERADLRSWLTLPHTFQAALVPVAPGVHDLELSAGGDLASLGTYALQPGEFMFILAREVGSQVHVHPVGGEQLSPTPQP